MLHNKGYQLSFPTIFNRLSWIVAAGSILLFQGCTTTGVRYDPLEPLNRVVYKFNDTADKAVLKPVAKGYKAVMPTPARTGVGNFFSNLDDVVVTGNDLFQFKFGQAVSDFSRFVFNSSFGVLGFIDVSTSFGLPKHDEDFGQTLGYWGIGSGPYVVLPFLGPSTLRDAAGLYVDSHIDPVWRVEHVPTRNTLYAVRAVDNRARLLQAERILDQAAIDEYAFVRDAYIQKRRSLVYDGHPPKELLEDYDE